MLPSIIQDLVKEKVSLYNYRNKKQVEILQMGPNIMTVAQAVLEIFCSHGDLLHKITKSTKGDKSAKYKQNKYMEGSGIATIK